ncbi:Rhamnosyl O-methyltransferase precursor [Roseibium album]|nr:Rhamnosyl O-methyltransferase precursor [Roseibium album]
MVQNDIEEFERNKVERCLELGRDVDTFIRSAETITDLDRFDYSYLWSWLGLPIIQFPADIVVTQEIIWKHRPDVIIETGVARGGSMIFLASMMQLLGNGKVIGVDIDIRAHNREAIESHPLSHRVTLIEGPSTAPEVMAQVREEIHYGEKVMVILDSDHSRDHVLDELRSYGPLITKGQYLVVADTVLGRLSPEQTPKRRSQRWEPGNEPLTAVRDFLQETDRFEVDEVVNGKLVLSSSPGGYLLCTGV